MSVLNIQLAEGDFGKVSLQVQQDPLDEELLHQVSNSKERLLELLKCEKAFYAQKSATDWIQLGDRNTHYFHARMKRLTSARISCLADAGRRIVTENDKIKEQYMTIFLDCFQLILASGMKLILKLCSMENCSVKIRS